MERETSGLSWDYCLSWQENVRPGIVLPTSCRQSETSSAGKMPAAR